MKVLPGNTLQHTADFDRNTFFLLVGPEYTLDDVIEPKFWAHHVAKLKVNSKIEVVAEDGSFDIELRVTKTGIGFVHTRILRQWTREGDAVVEPAPDVTEADIPKGYIVNHAPKTRWRVLTDEPRQEVSRDHVTKQHAIVAAIAHAKASALVAA